MCADSGKRNFGKADAVIIGGGGSGLAAALAAAEKGTGNIVVLEKRGAIGGNTARATGLFACESPAQERDRIIADKDELFEKAMHWSHWSRVNPRILRAFLNKSGDTIRWLENKGLEFTVIAFFPNQNPRVEHVPKGKGAFLMQVMTDECKKLGVQIHLNRGAIEVLSDKEGKVSGVVAIEGDEMITIQTTCVVIATGGFGGNKELLKKMCPLYYEDMPLRGLALNGDGIRIAEKTGAVIEDFVTLLKEGPRVDGNAWPLAGLEREPFTLWVNNKGQRFTDEATGDHPFEGVNQIIRQPDRRCYTLLDNDIAQKAAGKIAGLAQRLQDEVSKGRVKISSRWDAIADWVGVDGETLKATVEEYNLFCQHGHDELFGKDSRYLLPLKTPPYVAILGRPYLLDTLGGIRVNERMEVLNILDKPIPGLFAAGVATSGWEAEAYCSDLSGSAFGYAINSGRIAGENVSEFVSRQSAEKSINLNQQESA